MSIAKALDRNMTLLTEGEKQKALRYQSQWESLLLIILLTKGIITMALTPA